MIASLNIPLLELCDLILTYVLVTVLVPWQRQFLEKKPFSWSLITLREGWSMIIMMVSRYASAGAVATNFTSGSIDSCQKRNIGLWSFITLSQWCSSSKIITLLQQTPSPNLSKQLSNSRTSIKTMSFGGWISINPPQYTCLRIL